MAYKKENMKPLSIKKQAQLIIITQLEKNLQDLNYQLLVNKRDIKTLAEKQTLIKKQRVEIGQLLSVLRKSK